MPIYKGDTLINNVKFGGQDIANIYHGNVSVFSHNLLPYRVRITGDGYLNNYNSAGSEYQSGYGISSYFAVDNTSNAGSTGYGVLLNTTAFNMMLSIATGHSVTSYTCTISKDAGYNFISLFIGFNVFDIDFTNFNISSPFYALDMSEGQNDGTPVDLNNTHGGIFEENGNSYDMTYKILDGTDFTALSYIQAMSVMTPFTLMPLGKRMDGFFAQVGPAILIASQSITFNDTYAIPTMEVVMNNNTKVMTNLVQSLTNNFNFTIKSLINSCLPEIISLNGNLTLTGTGYLLHIVNYIPPQENIPGILETALEELSLGE